MSQSKVYQDSEFGLILFLLRIFNQHSGRKACLSRHDPWNLSRDHWMIFLRPIRFGIHIWLISNRFHRQVSRSLTNLFYKTVKIEVISSSKRIEVIIQHYSPIRSLLLDFFFSKQIFLSSSESFSEREWTVFRGRDWTVQLLNPWIRTLN